MLRWRACVCLSVAALSAAWVAETFAAKAFNIKEPVLAQVTNPCDPAEIVFFSGTRTTSLFLTENKNTFHLHGHSSSQHVTGFGLATGDEYNVIGAEGFQLSSAKGTTQTAYVRTRLIRRGSNQNLVATTAIHITVNANGTVTAQTDRMEIECH